MELYSHPLLGYRLWILSDEGIGSLAMRHNWKSGMNVAQCVNHKAPKAECDCGLYAYYELNEALAHMLELKTAFRKETGDKLVLGAVAAGGDAQLHSLGFRAEKMQLLGFYLSARQAVMGRSSLLKNKYKTDSFLAVNEFISYTESLASPLNQKQIDHLGL